MNRMLVTGKDAAMVAENAIGLFIEEIERRGGAVVFPDTASAAEQEDMRDTTRSRAVAEVVQGIEAYVPRDEHESMSVERAFASLRRFQRGMTAAELGNISEAIEAVLDDLVRARSLLTDLRGIALNPDCQACKEISEMLS